MSDYSMTIGGQAAGAGASFAVLNPATGQVTARAPECGRDELDRAMDAGQQAQAGWAADAGARRAALAALADAVEADAAGLARLITQEQGKPLREARAEVGDAIGDLRYFAGLQLEPARVGSGHPAVSVIRRPVGPVAAITPWNFPLGTVIAKVAPGLAAGCTMIVKPSPHTPLAALRLGELARGILPAGVLNVISGSNEVGAWMTSHPVPRMVSFTGSIATGKRIAAAAAPDLKRVTLELGGNDPAIVLDDVSVADVAGAVFDNAFSNCGQVCVAVKRVFVPEHLHADFTEALAERARAARVGDGQDEDTQVGPLCNQMQFDRVRELVSDAVAAGAKVAAGGRPAGGPGYFFEPTVLSGIGDETRIVAEEQFGPAIPVLPYRDVADAVRRANGTHFGLGASVWTSDPERGAAIAPSIESGTVWVNTHQSAVPGQPFGGLKHSGIGVEGGTWGLEAFTDVQVVHIRDRA
ncbi:MAG TPA: aldehyde dehydrogenase family protein [Streptosporangiaceae bacterium]|nr:aldehyde dehydrogenase family protein [Streptosporangiaceae bacterium]